METVPNAQGSAPNFSTTNHTNKRKPKGRFGPGGSSRGNFRTQYLVVNRTTDLNEDTGRGAASPSPTTAVPAPFQSTRGRNSHSRYKRHDYGPRPKTSNSSEVNWRRRDDTEQSRPATSHHSSHQSTTSASASSVQQFQNVELDNAPKPSLNAEAQPFVPSFKPKPQPTKHMAKLGKVKRQQRRQYVSRTATVPDSGTSEKLSQEEKDNGSLETEKLENVSAKKSSARDAGAACGPEAVGTKTRGNKELSSRSQSIHGQDSQDTDRYYLKQRQKENRKQLQKTRAERPDRPQDDSNEKKKPSKRNQYAYLHDFKERKPVNAVNVATQRESMIETLTNATYECTICYSSINQQAALFSCSKCYHMFHFFCIKKWANTLIAQNTESKVWRCPTCQDEYRKMPNQYKCFCGKVRDPVWNSYDTPHSCGEVCGRKRADNCSHPCSELCHPGPCPPCSAYTSKHCNCRRSYQKVKCSQQVNVRCSQTCNLKLNCGIHSCTQVCHGGACKPCDQLVIQECHCGEKSREVTCGSEYTRTQKYSCLKVCDKPLTCGNHNCKQHCHPGDCLPCETSPEVVFTCNCGKTNLSQMENVPVRTSCSDPIPSCEKSCGKILQCGTKNKLRTHGDPGSIKYHVCERKCHSGPCSCQLTSQVTCVCGNKTTDMSCDEAMRFTERNPYKCEKKCSKKRECGRHKCGQSCCTLTSHPCLQICGKRLTCGNHKCEELCHLGNCPTCYNVSFDELWCHCGIAVLYPPIPCGTRAPECHEMCTRVHSCEHPITHNCHSDPECPPCVTLTTKLCMGGHEYRNNIPCYIKDISCGKLCSRQLQCGDHRCPKTCHKDNDCSTQKCRQPCIKARPSCGHPCGAECHSGKECPTTDCNRKVLLKCQCGNRKEQVLCFMKDKKLSATVLTMKVKELNSSIDIAELMSCMEKKELRCDENCAQIERNRRMATALDIVNPELLFDLSTPQFSDFLKGMARKEPTFIAEIEKALCELVSSAQQSKQESRMRSHVFKPMKKDHRQAIHELAEFYSCTTMSYDEEPQRNVVAMANRGKACMPQQTLTSYIKIEKRPRAPVPIPLTANVNDLRVKSQMELQSTTVKPEENKIDYFDMT